MTGPSRIGVLGAGPGGLYFALLAKKSDPSRDIVVVERNPPDATFGWGVVFSDETMGSLRDADRETYQQILDSFARWGAIDVRYRGETIRSRGHVFSGTPRRGLLMILQQRCRDLGVRLEFHREVASLEAFDAEHGPFDLIVAADGVNSMTRREHPDRFVPSEDVHATKFAWYGTDLVFDAFTFMFKETPHGMFQVHAYPFDAQTSTFIVETLTSTWERAGLAEMSEGEAMAWCEDLFADELAGHKLMSNRSLWVSFVTLRCESWHRGNVVLLGDACHTAHFTIGSGTKLAMEDAIALSAALDVHGDDLERALTDYELERQPVVERFQEAARDSATYFESVGRYGTMPPLQFAFNLLTRSGRIGHLELERRDPSFIARIDAWLQERAFGPLSEDEWRLHRSPGPGLLSRPPILDPLHLANTTLWNRVVTSMATDAGGLVDAAGRGAALVVASAAVSPEGRVDPDSSMLATDEHQASWRAALDPARHASGGTRFGLRLGHAGRRGSCRPGTEGADRPLRSDGWRTVAPSAVRFSPRHPGPVAVAEEEMVKIHDDFESSASLAAAAGFDLLELDIANGYLLASFLSPLTNRRDDSFGGSLAARMRFPLEVFERVRRAWPDGRPLAVRLHCHDWVRGGFDIDDAVIVARELKGRGCDLIEVAAGQTVPHGQPDYRRLYLVGFADRIRNEVGILTMVGGNVASRDDANTILAAGRADLCLVDPRLYASAS